MNDLCLFKHSVPAFDTFSFRILSDYNTFQVELLFGATLCNTHAD